jgi:hypothetical protein
MVCGFQQLAFMTLAKSGSFSFLWDSHMPQLQPIYDTQGADLTSSPGEEGTQGLAHRRRALYR